MNVQNQSEGELHKAKGKAKETAENPAEGLGQATEGLRQVLGSLAENIRASAKSEMIIAGLLNEVDENTNKIADEVRENAKRESTMAGFIRDIRETTDRLAEETIESLDVTKKQGIQQLQQAQQGEQQPQQPQQAQQTQDTEGKSAGEARVSSGIIDHAMETTGGTFEYYREGAERLRKEVAETAKKMRRDIRK